MIYIIINNSYCSDALCDRTTSTIPMGKDIDKINVLLDRRKSWAIDVVAYICCGNNQKYPNRVNKILVLLLLPRVDHEYQNLLFFPRFANATC